VLLRIDPAASAQGVVRAVDSVELALEASGAPCTCTTKIWYLLVF